MVRPAGPKGSRPAVADAFLAAGDVPFDVGAVTLPEVVTGIEGCRAAGCGEPTRVARFAGDGSAAAVGRRDEREPMVPSRVAPPTVCPLWPSRVGSVRVGLVPDVRPAGTGAVVVPSRRPEGTVGVGAVAVGRSRTVLSPIGAGRDAGLALDWPPDPPGFAAAAVVGRRPSCADRGCAPIVLGRRSPPDRPETTAPDPDAEPAREAPILPVLA